MCFSLSHFVCLLLEWTGVVVFFFFFILTMDYTFAVFLIIKKATVLALTG